MEAFSHSFLEKNSSAQNFHQLILKGRSLASVDLIITLKVSEHVLKREKIFKCLQKSKTGFLWFNNFNVAQLKEILDGAHEVTLMRFFNTAINRLRKKT